jgi:hypothetical protein
MTRVAQQELAETVASSGEVEHHVGPRPAEVAHRLLRLCGDADHDELAGTVQPHEPAGVTAVRLDPVARSLRD